MATLHAKLSASGSSRWLNCPGSVKAEEGFTDKGSAFAFEGTCAHELAELALTNNQHCSEWVGKQLVENNQHTVDHAMADYVQIYVDYVRQFSGHHLYEVQVDFSDWVPDGFGTSDALIVADNVLHVIDLKYGKGVKVDAANNTQGMLYALGAIADYGDLFAFDKIQITIVQPRLDHIDEWEITLPELLKWGEWVRQRAELALSDNAERLPGEKQCQWCKAKAVCPKLKAHTEKLILSDFDDLELTSPERLTDAQLREALENKKLICGWLDAVESYVTNKLETGEHFDGFKLVAGRSLRQWINEDTAAEILQTELDEKAFTKKLISPAQAEKALGKKRADVLADLICKPEGKPTLAPESDPRPAMNITQNDFDCLTTDE